jgi:hypothetical protein
MFSIINTRLVHKSMFISQLTIIRIIEVILERITMQFDRHTGCSAIIVSVISYFMLTIIIKFVM